MSRHNLQVFFHAQAIKNALLRIVQLLMVIGLLGFPLAPAAVAVAAPTAASSRGARK